jgi:outer membrane biosynthesis protein TonB
MKLPVRSVAWVLPLFLTACIHWPFKKKVQPLPPPIDTTQSSTVPPPAQLPPPEVTIPTKPPVTETKLPAQTPKPPPKHKKPPANPTTATETQQASSGTPAVSAIGQLSSGDPAEFRRQTESSIASTENGLKAITRPLNDQEQKTAAHIREFLKQARTALASGDVDGASTLAAKAKVLLGELQR